MAITEIQETGLIPLSTAVFATNYQISDNTVGKYISLNGARKFYAPGIGLQLSAPNNTPVNNTLRYDNITTVTNSASSLLNAPYGSNNSAFFIFDTLNPVGDTINGTVKNPIAINNWGVANLANIHAIVAPGNTRILNVMENATFKFTFSVVGTIQTSGNHGQFNMTTGFYFNINGNETLVGSEVNTSSNGNGSLANQDFVIENFTLTQNLKVGDYVQLYGKILIDNSVNNCLFVVRSSELVIEETISTVPTQTTFTNPLGITDFNISSINLYGANRDTLMLQGTKLLNT